MLLPMAVFVTLIDTLRSAVGHAVLHPPDPRDLERKIRCPRCHQTMDTHLYAGPGAIVIDSCSECQFDWSPVPPPRNAPSVTVLSSGVVRIQFWRQTAPGNVMLPARSSGLPRDSVVNAS